MKRLLLTLVLLGAISASSYAQFEKGKKYVGSSFTSGGLSYSDREDLALGLNAEAGYMIDDDWMVLGECGIDYANSDFRSLYVGAKGRYYIEQNGLFLGAGLRLLHEFKNYNDVLLTPEVGYCFFLNRTVTVEPALYYNISLSDFSHNCKFGLRVGIGLYF